MEDNFPTNQEMIQACVQLSQELEPSPFMGKSSITFQGNITVDDQRCAQLANLRNKIYYILRNRELHRDNYFEYINFTQNNYLEFYIKNFWELLFPKSQIPLVKTNIQKFYEDLLSHIQFNLVVHSFKRSRQVELDEVVKNILYRNNLYQFVIETIIIEIEEFLRIKIGEKFKIKVYIDSDIEFQEWREIIFLIKTENIEFTNLINVWDELGDLIKNKIMTIKEHSKNKDKIDEIYQEISIEFDEI